MNEDLVPGIGNEVVTTFLLLLFLGSVLLLSMRGQFGTFYGRGTAYVQQFVYGNEAAADTPHTVNQPSPYNSGACPICLNEHVLSLETNCGHVFCGSCIRSYYESGGFFSSAMSCPLCRQMISMFFVCFSELDMTEQLTEERNTIVRLVRAYNERFSGAPRPLLSYIRDWPTLMRHLCNEFFTVGGLVYMFRIRIVMCLLAGLVYLFSPLDILPEAVFGVLGLLDDVFVLALLAIYVSIIYRRVVVARNV